MKIEITYRCVCGARLQLLTGWNGREASCPNCDNPVPCLKEIVKFLQIGESISTEAPAYFEVHGLDE